MHVYDYRMTIYNSEEWEALIKQGWFTMYVNGLVAHMIREVK